MVDEPIQGTQEATLPTEMAAPEAEAAPAASEATPAEVDEFEADARTLDSKAMAAKYPKRWEALRPHIDRGVTTGIKNFEAKHNEELQRRGVAQQWTTWWDGLTEYERQAQPAEKFREVAVAKQILETATVSPEVTQAARRITEGLYGRAKAYEPDADFSDIKEPEELFDRVIDARWAKKEKQMESEQKKAVAAQVREQLALAGIDSEQPAKLPGGVTRGQSLSSYLNMSSAEREAFRRERPAELDRMTREAMGGR